MTTVLDTKIEQKLGPIFSKYGTDFTFRTQDSSYNVETGKVSTGVLGETSVALGDAVPDFWDDANTVDWASSESDPGVVSKTDEEVLAGANRIQVGDEVLAFATVQTTGSGPFLHRLSRLLRGLDGTDDEVDGHVIGETIQFLGETFTVKGTPPSPVKKQYVNGETIKLDDMETVIQNPTNFTPKVNMEVENAGTKYRIVSLSPLHSGDRVAAWEIRMRRQ